MIKGSIPKEPKMLTAADGLSEIVRKTDCKLKAGNKITIELEVVDKSVACDVLASFECVSLEREESLAGIFRVNSMVFNSK